MNIGIIGGGAAGLAAAWLLQANHQVTLFEKQDRLGGHADTVDIEDDGGIAHIDAGFEFFFDSMFPRFNRLLEIAGAVTHRYPISATVYSTESGKTRLLPPYGREHFAWSGYRPAAIFDLLRLRRVIARSIPLIEVGDPFITLEDHLRTLNLSARFRDDFLYPFLLAQWCVGLEEFKTFSAYNALKYTVMSRPTGFPPMSYANEVVGGTQAYIAALAKMLTQTHIRLAAEMRSIERVDHHFEVREANSGVYQFDQLIVATGAHEASQLLQPMRWTETRRAALDRIDYFTTTIAVHEDARLMPENRKHWSVVNTRFAGGHSSNTIWKPWKSKRHIFRSWVTHDADLPELPVHIVRSYQHPKVNLNYFRAQRELIAQQGNDNLWLAGLYMHDIDCHESALMSAVNIARKLDPGSANLQTLMSGH